MEKWKKDARQDDGADALPGGSGQRESADRHGTMRISYSEQDLKYAAEFREGVHQEALAIIRRTRPNVTDVIDRHPAEDYFQSYWDYPGKWYTMVAIPSAYASRKALVDAIVRDTLSNLAPEAGGDHTHDPRDAAGAEPDRSDTEADGCREPSAVEDPFFLLLNEYPDLVVDYRIIRNGRRYWGYESHREALKAAYRGLGEAWDGNPALAVGKKISADALISSAHQSGGLNYRRAFLYPPHENGYTGKDFARVNAALFPNGTDALEVYEWSTDWSSYFDEGREWWGALCLTAYDQSLDRFVVILASATD